MGENVGHGFQSFGLDAEIKTSLRSPTLWEFAVSSHCFVIHGCCIFVRITLVSEVLEISRKGVKIRA